MKFLVSIFFFISIHSWAADFITPNSINFNQDSSTCSTMAQIIGGLSTDQILITGYCSTTYYGPEYYTIQFNPRVAISSTVQNQTNIPLNQIAYGEDGTNCAAVASNLNLISNELFNISVSCSSGYTGYFVGGYATVRQ